MCVCVLDCVGCSTCVEGLDLLQHDVPGQAQHDVDELRPAGGRRLRAKKWNDPNKQLLAWLCSYSIAVSN